MPYEQAINAKYADGRSDVYALGATLYHLVTGSVPFPGENHLEVVEKKNLGDFPPASSLNPAVPRALDQILARMLARQPRDRYQTASELIVDLERSRLAAAVPSFADPAQALQDPVVQARLASSAEPTRPDLAPPPAAPKPAAEGQWVLRYRNRAGRLCKARATKEQIVQRLRDGRLPAEVEACRPAQQGFQPLKSYPEFKGIVAENTADGRAPDSDQELPVAEDPPAGVGRRRWLLVGAAVGVALAAAALTLVVRALIHGN
jgi:serine/threonine-protein kinase